MQPFDVRHRRDAARARAAVIFHDIEKQQRGGRRIDGDFLQFRRRRRNRRGPIGNNIGTGWRSDQCEQECTATGGENVKRS
jgi:hypothetical protein